MRLAVLLVVAALLSAAAGMFALRHRALAPVDPPEPDGTRKRQPAPMPLIGGACMSLVALVSAPFLVRSESLAELGAPFVVGLLLALAVGAIDDWNKEHGFAWPLKLAGQAAAACAFLLHPDPPVAPALGVAWLIVTMNAWNLLDNTDGVPAWTGIGVAAPLLFLAGGTPLVAVAAVIAGSLLGFLPLNWPRPRAYLGDAGAHALGFALGWLSLVLARRDPVALLALHAVPLADMAQVVWVRLWWMIPPWRPDRRHLAHRLQSVLPVPVIAPCFFLVQAALTILLV